VPASQRVAAAHWGAQVRAAMTARRRGGVTAPAQRHAAPTARKAATKGWSVAAPRGAAAAEAESLSAASLAAATVVAGAARAVA
jgi:hypothetical protein